MPNTPPPISELVTPDEFTFTLEEELRLLDARPRATRWWVAPVGTPPPAPDVDGVTFATEWSPPWTQLNDPATDESVGVFVIDRDDPAAHRGGLFVLANPTPEACQAWADAYTTGQAVTIGAERVAAPGYRAIFPVAFAIHPVAGRAHVRYAVLRPPGAESAWMVFAVTGGRSEVADVPYAPGGDDGCRQEPHRGLGRS